MTAHGQLDLLAALGYAVFEQTDGSFQLLGPSPDWLPHGSLTEAFPFLDVFLLDAEEFWKNPGRRAVLNSDFWTQTSSQGNELHLSASAIAGDRRLLLVECADQRYRQTQSFVQYAHEASLVRDEIAKLSHELERATQAKSEFLARMSHEIRTPLNALLGMAELLSETRLDDEQREYVRVFRRSGDNLLTIINDILDFSKVEAGQVELEKIAFDLTQVLAEALEIAGVRARAKGLGISSRIQPDVPAYLVGDPGRLRQILMNLLGNATKFTERGELTVVVELDPAPPPEPTATTLHFLVSDTGIGIPPDRLSTIFDSFSQADAATTRKFGGTGLGLAISKNFVELMGGRIWAESTMGSGSTMHFTAKFPIAEGLAVSGAIAGKPPKEMQAVRPHRTLRILLADDWEENRFLIRSYLKDSGWIIDEVENGALAVERFKQRSYDIVLMDSEMPMLDGYSATRQMREFEREGNAAPTPILALTAHALQEARDRSFKAGCTDHLTKPINKATLLKAIDKFVPAGHGGDRIQVSVEPWLKPVVGGYLKKRRDDVQKLRTALEHGDHATIRTLGHQMAGTGGGYGFDPITEIGGRLEAAALAGEGDRMRVNIEELDRYLNAVQVE